MESEEFCEVVFTAEVPKAHVDEFVKHVFSNCNWSLYAKCFTVRISQSGGGVRSTCNQGQSFISTPKRKVGDCGIVAEKSEEEKDHEPLKKRICSEEAESHLSAKIIDESRSLISESAVQEPRSCSSDLAAVSRCAQSGFSIAKESDNIRPVSLTQDNFEVKDTCKIAVLDPVLVAPVDTTTVDQQNGSLNVKAEVLHFNFSESNIVDYEDNDDSIVATEVYSSNRCEEINLVVLSDDENEKQNHASANSLDINASAEPTLASFSKISRESLLQQKRFASVTTDNDLFVLINNPRPHIRRLAKKSGNIYADQVCSKICLIQECVKKPNDQHVELSHASFEEWTEFYKKVGKTITALKLDVWSWRFLNSSCPFNINKLLRDYCPNIQELLFCVGPKEIEYSFEFLMRVTNCKSNAPLFLINELPALQKLVIHAEMKKQHSKKIPTLLLQRILEVAPNLEEFWYEFRNKRDANLILTTMSNFKGNDDWKKLKALRISYKESGGCLSRIELRLLSSFHAKNLQELILECYVWEDANEKYMKKLFENFPLLRKFILCGTYKGDPLNKSSMTLIIPALEHLEHFEIDSHSEFESVIEEPSSQITNKYSSDHPRECLELLPNDYAPRPGRYQLASHDVTVEDVTSGEQFIVSIGIPHLMPKLKTIILDEFFEFEDLHFSSIPQISTFRVKSKWHLSSKFPYGNSRRSSFPFLAELQIPNYLRDESFLWNLPNKFPNLTKCSMYLPTVKVLRAFFKTMADSKLDTLILVTRFYFESTFEICFFGERGMEMGSLQSRIHDWKKWKKLGKYELFEKFVDHNDVEGPCWENIDELCDNEKYAGLGDLKNLKVLEIKHVPMLLKIPMGNKDWKIPEAEFTENFIGFIKYPLSSAFIDQLPSWVQYTEWPNFEFMK